MPDQMQPKQIPNYWDFKALRDQIEDHERRIKALEDLVKPQDDPSEKLADWGQRVLIMRIATALNLNLGSLEAEIDLWSKEQAQYWIEKRLPEFNKKTRGWRLTA
jgi:Ser-tRNA(Ala) deacylase AlaX